MSKINNMWDILILPIWFLKNTFIGIWIEMYLTKRKILRSKKLSTYGNGIQDEHVKIAFAIMVALAVVHIISIAGSGLYISGSLFPKALSYIELHTDINFTAQYGAETMADFIMYSSFAFTTLLEVITVGLLVDAFTDLNAMKTSEDWLRMGAKAMAFIAAGWLQIATLAGFLIDYQVGLQTDPSATLKTISNLEIKINDIQSQIDFKTSRLKSYVPTIDERTIGAIIPVAIANDYKAKIAKAKAAYKDAMDRHKNYVAVVNKNPKNHIAGIVTANWTPGAKATILKNKRISVLPFENSLKRVELEWSNIKSKSTKKVRSIDEWKKDENKEITRLESNRDNLIFLMNDKKAGMIAEYEDAYENIDKTEPYITSVMVLLVLVALQYQLVDRRRRVDIKWDSINRVDNNDNNDRNGPMEVSGITSGKKTYNNTREYKVGDYSFEKLMADAEVTGTTCNEHYPVNDISAAILKHIHRLEAAGDIVDHNTFPEIFGITKEVYVKDIYPKVVELLKIEEDKLINKLKESV